MCNSMVIEVYIILKEVFEISNNNNKMSVFNYEYENGHGSLYLGFARAAFLKRSELKSLSLDFNVCTMMKSI